MPTLDAWGSFDAPTKKISDIECQHCRKAQSTTRITTSRGVTEFYCDACIADLYPACESWFR